MLSSWGDRAHVEKRGQAWLDTLEPVVESMRAAVRGLEPQVVAARTGALYEPLHSASRGEGQGVSVEGTLWLRYLNCEYRITWPDLIAYPATGDQSCPANLQGMFLYYLRYADGTPRVGRWLSFRELPSGGFYHHAFQGYTGNRLIKHFGNDLEAFRRAGRAVGGMHLDIGDAGLSFDVLPRVPVAIVYWQGDEEFPPNAQLLFDASAPGYLPTDAFAVLGSQLVGRLIKEAEGAVAPAEN